MRRLTLDTLHERAALRGGRCLSTVYPNSGAKLLWQCSEGHRWEASSDNIKQGRWCPHCSRRAPLTLEAMQGIAAKRGGRCLSTAYVNSTTKLRWECSKGHQWEATPNNVRNGDRWCPTCFGSNPYTLADMQALASARQGECLSLSYTNVRAKLRWRCSKGHEWAASATSLLSRKSWCPHCAGQTKVGLSKLKALAAAKGGACLAETYLNNRVKCRWRCAFGHEWDARVSHVLAGHWCPYCQDQSGERSCREWLETHFLRPFPKVWPDWLRGSNGRKLQLDGYNDELRLAFEYQGAQHFQYVPWFHATRADFENQVRRDAEKIALCRSQGIDLVVISYQHRPVGAAIKKRLPARLLGVKQDND